MRFAAQATLVATGLFVLSIGGFFALQAGEGNETKKAADTNPVAPAEVDPPQESPTSSPSQSTQAVLQDQEFETTEGDPDLFADSPFDAVNFNEVLGIGGGAGGSLGGRFGSRSPWNRIQGTGERYAELPPSGFVHAAEDPRSTFSVDVDTAAYANVRRMIMDRSLPPFDAVRIEELLNYFPYSAPLPAGDSPFGVASEVSECPWAPEHRLARVTLATTPVHITARKPANLVFLVDVSGSMQSRRKLPLLKRSLKLLVGQLQGRDRVALVVYAGAAGLVLPSTGCADKASIHAALDRLEAGGSTAGSAGISLAYSVAREHFVEGGINRVLLATDGDFNVGATSDEALVELVEDHAQAGVELTVLGFGNGNLNDSMLERITGSGNGNYAYIDSLLEARKVLVQELGATLETVAADAKIQVTFDPDHVARFRLIGYENRRLEHRDFTDDSKGAGEIGAGHGVTALYEVVLHQEAIGGSWMEVVVRAKPPIADSAEPAESAVVVHHHVIDQGATLTTASADHGFAAAVAAYGQLLRRAAPQEHGEQDQGPFPTPAELASVRTLAAANLDVDLEGYRASFVELLDATAGLFEQASR